MKWSVQPSFRFRNFKNFGPYHKVPWGLRTMVVSISSGQLLFLFLLLLASVSVSSADLGNQSAISITNSSSIHHHPVIDRTPRSIDLSKPIRVFKYVTDSPESGFPTQQNETLSSTANAVFPSRENETISTSPPKKGRKGHKKSHSPQKKRKLLTTNPLGFESDPLLKLKTRAGSVTDRSLIPNSFYPSQQNHEQNENVEEQPVNLRDLPHHAADASSLRTLAVENHSNNNNSVRNRNESQSQNQQENENSNHNHSQQKEIEISLNANATERMRRSPFRRNGQRMTPQQQNFRGNFRPAPNMVRMKMPVQMQRPNPNVNPRAALYNRNPGQGFNFHSHQFPPNSASASNLLQIQIVPDPEPTPTFNHPFYKRYSKVAKSVRNKVSGMIVGGRPTSRGPDYRPDFSKLPPMGIPLPRPKMKRGPPPMKGHGHGHGHGPPPPGRYSYPKSAQSIQDILDHFGKDEDNEILPHPPKGSGSRYPDVRRNRFREREREREFSPPPASISDLSSELKDVRFSLLRDIKEFAKRPMTLGDDDDHADRIDRDREREEISRRERQRTKPIVLKSPYEEEEDRWRKRKKDDRDRDRDRDRDPFAPGYDHESGFDEIFSPRPKPVRDLVDHNSNHGKKSSRFRYGHGQAQGHGHNDERLERERDRVFNLRKRKRGKRPSYDEDEVDRYSPKPSHSSTSRYGLEPEEEDSTERVLSLPTKPGFSSVEIEIERKESKRRHRVEERDEPDRDHYDHDHDRKHSRERESFPAEKRRPTPSRNYPKSIMDKIRDMQDDEIENNDKYVGKRPSYQHQQPSVNSNSKPIVLKRPYEPYTIPTEMQAPSPPEYWNNYPSATEKALYGLSGQGQSQTQTGYQLNPRPSPATYLNQQQQAMANQYGQFPTQIPNPVDLIGIHQSLPRQHPTLSQIPQDSMQKAYLELLQQKINSEASLLNSQAQAHGQSPNLQRAPVPTTKKPPSPMRMKIHIYPNEQTVVTEGIQHKNANIQNQNLVQPNFYTGGSSLYSTNAVPVLSARYPQKIGGSLGGYSGGMGMSPGPAPSISTRQHTIPLPHPGLDHGHSHHHPHDHSHGHGHNGHPLEKPDDKGKNVVLHLHVHRRNDVGPVELEAEGSNHFVTSEKRDEKPSVDYKEIYDDHPHDDHQGAQGANPGDNADGDKSVSMEVPIHDDKIEDVLHTLLQFRDRTKQQK